MILYIPKRLTLLEIVLKLLKMVEGYSEISTSDSTIDFDEYYYTYSLDPVKKFIEMCIPESNISSSENYTDVINYLVNLFYFCKGSNKIIELMKLYLNIDFDLENTNNTNDNLIFSINSINTNDTETWLQSFKEFLDNLLYYNLLKITLDELNTEITSELSGYTGSSLIIYKTFDLEI